MYVQTPLSGQPLPEGLPKCQKCRAPYGGARLADLESALASREAEEADKANSAEDRVWERGRRHVGAGFGGFA